MAQISDYYAVLRDLQRRRDLLDRTIAVIQDMMDEQARLKGEPVCAVDISRCPTLMEAAANGTAEEITKTLAEK